MTPEQFWLRVDIRGPDDCWLWKGRINDAGYGIFQHDCRRYRAHRYAYSIATTLISLAAPEDKRNTNFVLHRCDNRRCCNPAHLFLGSYQDNVRDMHSKQRNARYKASFPREEIAEIQLLASKGCSERYLAAQFNVSRAVIRRALGRL